MIISEFYCMILCMIRVFNGNSFCSFHLFMLCPVSPQVKNVTYGQEKLVGSQVEIGYNFFSVHAKPVPLWDFSAHLV